MVDLRLQPLRVPGGWLVDYSSLYEVDQNAELVPATDRWWVFKQDMLQMTHRRFNRLVDVGWYPEGDLEDGQYRIVLHEGDFRGSLLHEFSTRDRGSLVEEIERLLNLVATGKL